MMEPPVADVRCNLIKYIVKEKERFNVITSLNNIPKCMTMAPYVVLYK
jgi:hypothetical protein